MSRFVAGYLYFSSEGETYVAGLADSQFNTTRYFLCERLKEPTEQDLGLGFEQPYVEFDSQRFSGYGVSNEVELEGNMFRVSFTVEGAAKIGAGEPLIEIEISEDCASELLGFGEMLATIFGDQFSVDLRND